MLHDYFGNIPQALHDVDNWFVWREEPGKNGKPTKVPYHVREPGQYANVARPETWGRSVDAFQMLPSMILGHEWTRHGLGFAITEELGLICIDLDNPDKCANPDNARIVHEKLLEIFAGTYIEASPSGTGWHIWFYGKLPEGRRSLTLKAKASIEAYATGRYMSVTGKPTTQSGPAIIAMPNALEQFVAIMRTINGGALPAEVIEAADITDQNTDDLGRRLDMTDQEVFADAKKRNAKFMDAAEGKLSPDRSENALVVVGDLDKITGDVDQILRMLEKTPLGQMYDAYDLRRKFGYWISQVRVGNQSVLETREAGKAFMAEQMEREKARDIEERLKQEHGLELIRSEDNAPTDEFIQHRPLKVPFQNCPQTISAYAEDFPPGVVGWLAHEIETRASTRATRDFAVAAALGIMGGYSGHAYSVESVNGAMFMLLVGESGRGKEAPSAASDALHFGLIKHGIDKKYLYSIRGPGSFTSAQGLHKRLQGTRSMLSNVNEATAWFKRVFSSRPSPNEEAAKNYLLALWPKMGAGRSFNPSEVITQENKLSSLVGPAFTMIMEGQPNTFLEIVPNESYQETGFAARIIYVMGRPDGYFKKHLGRHSFSDELLAIMKTGVEFWTEMAIRQNSAYSEEQAPGTRQYNHDELTVRVQMTPDCRAHHLAFDEELDRWTNKHPGILSNYYNRAIPNILRVALNIAVGVSLYEPVITREIYEYAQAFVLRGLLHVHQHVVKGNVGSGDFRIREKIIEVLQEWAAMHPRERFKRYQAKGDRYPDSLAEKLKYNPAMPHSMLTPIAASFARNHVDKERASQVVSGLLRDLIAGGEVAKYDGLEEQGVKLTNAAFYSLSI